MKKITLLAVAFLVAMATQAQAIYEQPADGDNGIISDYYSQSDLGVYAGDDFELTEQTAIYGLEVYGFQGLGDLQSAGTLTGVNFYIYTDNAGEPSGDPTMAGAGEFELMLSTSDAGLEVTKVEQEGSLPNYNFKADIEEADGSPLTLDAGVYWIVAVPQLDADMNTAPDGTRWNWLNSTQTYGSVPKLIDPADVFGAGATSWSEVNALTDGGFDAMSFSIYDADMDVVKTQPVANTQVYPNPVNDQLNVQVANGVQIESATMFDVLGKATQVNVSANNTINTSNFASGLYILKLETSKGSVSKKIVKQ